MRLGTIVIPFALLASSCATSVSDTTDPMREVSVTDAEQGARGSKSVSFELAFITHLDKGFPEQDVFIEREPGSEEVWRPTLTDHDLDQPLFGSAVPIPHNPFDPKALGPHPKGEALGLTLGQWLHHQGRGRYTYEDGQGRLELEFTGLVPDAVYTMWHAFTAVPPTEPFSGALELPLGARDGSESAFRSDENGDARFVHEFSPGLQMSDVWTASMLAVAYHSDGKTWGGRPGDFGLNSHVPLFVMLPPREGIH